MTSWPCNRASMCVPVGVGVGVSRGMIGALFSLGVETMMS